MRSAERSQDSNRYWPKQEKLAASVCLDMLNRHLRQRLVEEQCVAFARDKDSDRC